MMTGTLATASIQRLAFTGDEGIDFAHFGHGAQGSVDRCEADPLPTLAQHLVQVLSRAEIVHLLQDGCDGDALPG